MIQKNNLLQQFINKYFFFLMIFTLLFGVIFYDVLHFNYTDEICTLLFCILYGYYVFKTPKWSINKLFIVVLSIFLFYLFYSLKIHTNSNAATYTDFVIQLKPYLAFFCIYAINPQLDKKQKYLIKQLCIISAIYLIIVGVISLFSYNLMVFLITHPSRLATASSIIALLYLYCSDYTKNDKLIFILLLSVGVLSGRAKFYGFFVLAVFLIFYIDKNFKLQFNLKNNLFLLVVLVAILLVAKQKIYLYFIQGGFGESKGTEDLYARMALYYFSIAIFKDYFPFGSGFGTYGTFASSEYYSPVYEQYGMNMMFGLSPNHPQFISDTYYPVLAQFGVIGAGLFFLFWINLSLKSIKYFKVIKQPKEFTIALLVIAFFLIECTSDSTITHNRGLFMMMILGFVLSNMHKQYLEQKSITI